MSFNFLKVSRHSALRALCLVLVVSQMSCTPKVGEAPPDAKDLGIKPTPCLDKATQSLGDFARGNAEPQALSEAWGCLSSAFTEFKKYVRGRESDRYSSQELATFIEDNFIEKNPINLRKRKISPELQVQFMKIKIILIGGSLEYLTRAELSDVINLFGEFRRMSLAINPSMKILTMNWKPDSQLNDSQLLEFENANIAIQDFVKDFSSLVKKNNPSYDLNDIPIFLKELEQFSEDTWEWLPRLDQYIPLIKKIKKAIAGGDESLVTPSEWRIFMLLGGRSYVQFLRYYYFISPNLEDISGNRAAYIARTFEDIFSIFQDLVAEKPSKQVSRIETAEILEAIANVWKGFKTSDNFVYEIMKIKRVVLGGSIEFWNSKDFESAKFKVNRLKEMITAILPHRRVYTMDWDPQSETYEEANVQFENARFHLSRALKELGGQFEEGYSSTDLISLLNEIEKLYPSEEGKKSIASVVTQYSCVAKDVKRILFDELQTGIRCQFNNGKPENWNIEKSQWSKLLEIGAQFYTAYLQYHYFVHKSEFRSAKDSERMSWFGNDTINLLLSILQKRANPLLKTEEIATLLKDMVDSDVLPKEIKPATVDQLAYAVVNNILNPAEDRLNNVRPAGINAHLLNNASYEFNIWSKLDLFFIDLYEKKQSDLLNSEIAAEINIALEQNKDDAHLMAALNEMSLVFNIKVPMTLDKQGRVLISSNNSNQRYSLYTLRQYNLYRLLARTLLRSYGLNLNRIHKYTGLKKCEAEAAYKDLGTVFMDIGMLDATNKSFITSRFTEANIFLPHSDGNQYASFQELHDLLTMIFSGFKIDNSLKVDLLKDCPPGGSDNYSRFHDKIPLACLRSSYKKNIYRDFASLPEYLRYFEKVSPAAWNESFFQNLKAAGHVPNAQQIVKAGEAALFPHIIQYTEMLFAKFDQNKDGILSKSDAIKAFNPTFKGILKELAKKQIQSGTIDESELEALFTFIVKYARIPNCDKSFVVACLFEEDIILWLSWKKNYLESDQTIYADRNQVARILGLIADEVRKPNNDPVPSPQQCGAD